jgi:hypothetical protein
MAAVAGAPVGSITVCVPDMVSLLVSGKYTAV